MNMHTARQVYLCEARSDTSGITWVGVVVSDEVQHCRFRWQRGDRVEEAEHALTLQPVADAEEGSAPPVSQVTGRRTRCRRDIASRRNDPQALARHAICNKLLQQRLASNHQHQRSGPCQAIERCLKSGAQRTKVNATGRLMQHANHGSWRTTSQEPGPNVGGCDTVQHKRLCPECRGSAQDRRSVGECQGKWTFGKRDELDARIAVRREFSEASMVEIPTGQLPGISKSQQGDCQMRVTHVSPTVFGSSGLFGGGERYPLELARALAREIECTLVTFGPESSVRRDASGLLVRVLQPRIRLCGHPAHPLALGMLAATRDTDLIHTHHMRSTPSRIAVLAARARRQAVVATDHGLQGGDWLGVLPRLFDYFLAVSQYSAHELRLPPTRTHVIYGGADPQCYQPDSSIVRDGVLFVGRITPHKGIDRLIQAVPSDARLRIAGSDGHDPELPERNYPALLRHLARGKRVEFLGPVGDEDLPLLYRQAQVLVLPSVGQTCYGRTVRVSELLGLVVLEAMASGTPVVCSRIGGLPEIVEDGVTGFLVEPGDLKGLHERLSELLGNPVLARRMGANARERVLESFTWQACADRCLARYQALLQAPEYSGQGWHA